jgi:serine/threonine-protein kinase
VQCAQCGAEVDRDTFFCPTCGALFPEQTAVGISDVESRQVLSSRYVILSLLGRGGMGAVYLAKDTQLDKVVAVKALPTEIACDLRAIEWMKEEVRIAQDLRHENIAAIYNFETDAEKQSCFIVMEFINGVDLHALLARSEGERLPLEMVRHMLGECSKALSYAHLKRIIHRDIKPKNVMVTKDGVVKVADFGIARRLHETMSKISQTIIAGTPAYMAPEHLMGKNIDARADIYSLGATVYELLSGTPPFHKGKIDIQILQKEVPPLDPSLFDGNAELTEKINAVMRKCLAKEPDDRYETATGFFGAFCEAAGTQEEPAQMLESLSAVVGAALVDQRKMLTRTVAPPTQSPTPLTPLSALEPTELTPPMPAPAPKRRRTALLVGLGVVLAFVALLITVPSLTPGPSEGPSDAKPVPPAVEGPPKLAIAEFIVEGEIGTNTSMSLANTVMYRAEKRIKDKYKIVEPLELKGILESLGMKVSQLTDYESAKRLYTERGIRYLILCTVVKGGYTEIEGRMTDLKDGSVMQREKPYLRHSGEIRYAAEKLGDILTLDDTHKKIYFLLSEARTHRARGEFEEAVAKINEALKLDNKDKSIHEYKVEFTEANVKEALDKCRWRKYDDALKYLDAVRKYNFSPELVKALPGKLFDAMVSEGESALAKKKYDEAIKAYESALKLKDDAAVSARIKEATESKAKSGK